MPRGLRHGGAVYRLVGVDGASQALTRRHEPGYDQALANPLQRPGDLRPWPVEQLRYGCGARMMIEPGGNL
ncbi:MAG TPA: hypothetical protein VFV38_26270 [Ktedonobacteraceae bacterium]|nr:hypothetical protein [Ktedonobacteraceae bacterium]